MPLPKSVQTGLIDGDAACPNCFRSESNAKTANLEISDVSPHMPPACTTIRKNKKNFASALLGLTKLDSETNTLSYIFDLLIKRGSCA